MARFVAQSDDYPDGSGAAWGEGAGQPAAGRVPWRLHACNECGLFLQSPPLGPDADYCCPRCDAMVHRGGQYPLTTPLALAAAGLTLCVMTLTTPLLSIRLMGQVRGSGIGTGAWAFLDDGLWMVAVGMALIVILAPLLRFSIQLLVVGGLLLRRPPGWLPHVLRWHGPLNAWCMLEVFLFGALVSYTRLADLAAVQFGPAIYGLGALVLVTVVADAVFDPEAIWDEMEWRGILTAPQSLQSDTSLPMLGCGCCRRVARARPGSPCPRCRTPLHHRKPASVSRCWALIVTAAILYVPANLYPVMTVVTIGLGGPHTIMGGIAKFIEAGFWPLAVVIFIASVVVPLLKLVGLAVMLVQIRQGSAQALRQRTWFCRLLAALGRWSMIDVFVVAVLIAVVRFGEIASITAEIGTACFGAVVILTMLATAAFDPRLMWDAAETGRDTSQQGRTE